MRVRKGRCNLEVRVEMNAVRATTAMADVTARASEEMKIKSIAGIYTVAQKRNGADWEAAAELVSEATACKPYRSHDGAL
jgi:hypothetical protein